jgi:hypothetical protein
MQPGPLSTATGISHRARSISGSSILMKFGLSALIACGAAASGKLASAQTSIVILSTTAIHQSSATAPVLVTMNGSGTAEAPVALTTGIAGKDYAVVAGGTCGAGPYNPGDSCTVNVVFTPLYPGQRLGAVVIKNSNGLLLGQTLLTGTATGSLAVLVPGEINTVAGDAQWIYQEDGVAATTTSIFLPTGVAVDAAGNFYISDSSNNRIRRVDGHTGLISTVAGNGTPGYGGDGAAGPNGMISNPAGIVIDGAGDVFFADTGNHVIRRIDAVTGYLSTVAGTGTAQGYTGDNHPANAATLSLPEGLAFDANGDLYIADTGNNVIREVNASTGVITTVAGTGVAGYNADGIPATTAKLDSPWNLVVGPDNSLYIADLMNQRIRLVSPLGIITTIAGNGDQGYAGDNGIASQSELNEPTAVILDPAGDLYIADSGNNRIREISVAPKPNIADNDIQTVVGTGGEQFVGDLDPASLANIYGPSSLFFDQTGDLFIADMFHNRVREVTASGLSLTFSAVRVGKVSTPPVPEAVQDDGNETLNIAAPTFDNSALAPAWTTCNTGTAVAMGTSCSLGIEFAPTTVGANVTGTLKINSDAANTPTVVNVSGPALSVNPTTTTVNPSPNPSLVGGTVTFTATVNGGGASLTGAVTILDGSATVCTANVNSNGVAVCSSSTLTLGSHSITASYAGDASDAASVSPAVTLVVQQLTTIALTAAPSPTVVTSNVTLTATVTAPSGTPAGNLVFYDGTTAIGSSAINTSGVATFSTTSLSAGTHSLTAQYAGLPPDPDAGAMSNVFSEVIQQATTTTTISSSAPTAPVGTTITFTSTVTNNIGTVPAGSVQFTDGATVLGSGTVGTTGIASISISTLTPGTHNIVATYSSSSSDTDDAASHSTVLVETIQQINTATTLTSSANPANAGASVVLSANVSMTTGSVADGTITGTVTFTNGPTTLGTVVVDANGNAKLTLTSLPVGNDSIVATYSGNTNYAGSTSTSLLEVINQTGTSTALTSGNQNSLEGKSTTFTATVTTSTGIATGPVNFLDNGKSIGSGTLNAQGVATLSLSTLPVGSDSIVAVYGGDSNYTTSTSTPLVEVVALATPTVVLAGPASPVNVATLVTLTGTITSNGVAPTGPLTLLDGSTSIATQNAPAGGSFTFSTSSLAIGTHNLSVAYAGDANNATATSNVVTIIVQQASTKTSLATSMNPQVLGQSVTFTASTSSVSPNVTGTIDFEDGGAVISSVNLGTDGNAVFTTSSLTAGTHTITAVYSGDTNHAASTSVAVSQLIVQAAGATFTSSLNPSVSGQNVVFTMKLASVGAVIPTGTVTFSDGGTTLGTSPVDGTGTATLQISTLAVGTHPMTASYSGDQNYAVTKATLTQTVQSASTQVALVSSANPATYGTPLAFTATVTSNGSAATGSVTFTDGSVTIGSALLNANGVAILTISTLAPDSHSIVANYAGNGSAGASVSNPLVQVVKETTMVGLASSLNPAQTLTPITLTATVTNSGVGVATGNVTFNDGTVLLGTAALNASGVATLTLPSLAAGNHSVVASYVGDANNFVGTSSALVQVVQLRPTITALTASETNANNPLQVTLISVERWTGTTVPTGTVTFMDGTAVLGSAVVDNTGVATLTIVLEAPSVSISAVYSGDTVYAGSTSPTVSVTGGKPTGFTMSLTPPTLTMSSSQHGVTTLTLTALPPFADTLQLGCDGLPTAASCTFSTTQVKVTPGTISNVTVTIDTGNPLGSGAESASIARRNSSGIMLAFLPAGLLAGIALFRSRRRSLLAVLLLLFAIMASLGVTGCGGLTINGTPPGTYTFKVTAVGQGTGIAEAQQMTLTVTK